MLNTIVSRPADRAPILASTHILNRHTYTTEPKLIGSSATYQPRCSCGWLSGVVYRGARAADESRSAHVEHVAAHTLPDVGSGSPAGDSGVTDRGANPPAAPVESPTFGSFGWVAAVVGLGGDAA